MNLPDGMKMRLDPQDEYTHTPEAAKNYNESMYFNMFDPQQKIGGWFRLGNRANEGYAEMSNCLYLPDGRVAFMFKRAEIDNNDAMDAGGMRFDVVEPFKQLKVSYDGKACLLTDPLQMANPKQAFADNPRVPVKMELDYTGLSPMHGGEMVHEDGTPLDLDPEKSFLRGHYEQHMAASGTIQVGDESWRVAGYGVRDKSWGPRFWQAIHWYRWLPMSFGPDFGIVISITCGEDGNPKPGGMVFEDGKYWDILEAHIDAQWDDNFYQTALKARVRTEKRDYEVDGRVLSLIPLRNRRKAPDGTDMLTRITEGMTEYRCDGRVGYGLSEFLDQIVDGKPVSLAA
ncbi:MAG: hypothetical protein ACE363_06910 [Alphaproteobacteria bacterium]